MTVFTISCLLALLAALAAAVWQAQKAEYWRRSAQDAELRATHAEATAQAEQRGAAEQLRLLEQSQSKLEQSFRALAAEALQANSQAFLDRSKEQVQGVVAPVQETLRQFDEKVRQLERARSEAYGSLTAQVANLVSTERELRQSSDQLRNALRSPMHRGRWGEVQLRRAVELAGMLAHCDFAEQVTLDGGKLRPDLVVKLPNDRKIVVDAKVSLDAYLRATETEEEAERSKLLATHAQQVRQHVKALADKSYWQQFEGSPEFVIAFLPLESIYSSALQQDGELLTFGVERKVLLATPTTLIGLLFAVAQGWRERAFVENATQIRQLGRELYDRISSVHGKMDKLGAALERSVDEYNAVVWNLESRVLVSARRFRELQGEQLNDLEVLEPLNVAVRMIR